MVGESAQEDVASFLPHRTEAVTVVEELSAAVCSTVQNVSKGAFC